MLDTLELQARKYWNTEPANGWRRILHIDMDAFFASVEVAINPGLEALPVVVCGDLNGRSAVCSPSYPARKRGIKSGMATSTALLSCRDGIFIPADHKKYIAYSLEIQQILLSYSPIMEPYSIDEAFLEVTQCKKPAFEIAENIKKGVYDNLRLPASIGIAPNRLLAKLGSDLAKPNGIKEILPQNALDILWRLPIESITGIGPKTTLKLNKFGIYTMEDLARFPRTRLEQMLGKIGAMLHRASFGIDNSPVTPYYIEDKMKSMGHERTLSKDVADKRSVKNLLAMLADILSARLRKNGYRTNKVYVKVKFSDLSIEVKHENLPEPTDYDSDLLNAADKCLNRIQLRKPVRAVGINAQNLFSKEDGFQVTIFEHERLKRLAISRALDNIRERFGTDSLFRAAEVEFCKNIHKISAR